MTLTLKINARNDIHLPAEALRLLNLGKERLIKAEVKGNCLVLVPVDLEPRYSHQELEKFQEWALKKDKGDIQFDTLEEGIQHLKKRIKKS